MIFFACLQADIHWTRLYTQRIDQNVKLVGSTISCQPIYWNSDTANEMRRNPHVQSYIVAMDQASPSFERYVSCTKFGVNPENLTVHPFY